MATNESACRRATMAAAEVIMENCDGAQGTVEEIGDSAFAFVPDDAKDEFGFDLNSPETESEREQAVESCMGSEWATDWAASVVGADAPEDAKERARRSVCEGLFE